MCLNLFKDSIISYTNYCLIWIVTCDPNPLAKSDDKAKQFLM